MSDLIAKPWGIHEHGTGGPARMTRWLTQGSAFVVQSGERWFAHLRLDVGLSRIIGGAAGAGFATRGQAMAAVDAALEISGYTLLGGPIESADDVGALQLLTERVAELERLVRAGGQ